MRIRTRNPEARARKPAAFGLVFALAVGGLGLTACGDDEPDDTGADRPTATAPIHPTGVPPTETATDGEATPAPAQLTPRPRDDMEMAEAPPDEEGRQRAWTPRDPQPWGPDNTAQVYSLYTKPVGGPVGVYPQPVQVEGTSVARVHEGEEYQLFCHRVGQFVRNDFLDGSDVWYQADIDGDGSPDQAYLPATNVGFTGVNAQGQHDGTLDKC